MNSTTPAATLPATTIRANPAHTGWRCWRCEARYPRADFERGCPLATVALESTADDAAIRAAVAQAFAAIRQRLALLLGATGLSAPRAASLATLTVAAYEGALMQARVAGQGQALTDTAEALITFIELELQHARSRP